MALRDFDLQDDAELFDQARQAAGGPTISVVIPAMNEARNLPHVFARMPEGIDEIILVDGSSVDDTVKFARHLCPEIVVIGQTRKGKGNALACGFARATGDYIVMIDADGSTDPMEIPKFIEALDRGADFAKGSRFMPGAGSSDISRIRQGRQLLAQQDRQRDLRDPLQRPLLWLQRVP